jgi:hypothetical protein
MRKRAVRLLAGATMILMAYCTTFLVWKHAAMGHASSQGLVGYYFFWPSSVSNVRREKVTRLIFFPITGVLQSFKSSPKVPGYDELCPGVERPAGRPIQAWS